MSLGKANTHTLIVGAGAAGCVLAARLSEDVGHTVTLLESGPDYTDVSLPPEIRYGYGPDGIFTTTHDWNYVARGSAGVPELAIPRGRVVGGSSAINAQVFLRGIPEDFDGWAAAGCEGWSFNEVLPYFRRIETDADYGADDAHGSDGPIYVRRYPRAEWRPDQSAFYEACLEQGLPDCPDHNRPGTTGVGPFPLNNRDRIRQSASLGYLSPARGRPNLSIQADCHVRRILFDGTSAVGAEANVGGSPTTFRADQVILCGGAIGTPHLLMLSGIGSADALGAQGIPVIADLPGVGSNLRDHPAVPVEWNLVDDVPVDMMSHYHQVGLRYTAEGSDLTNDMIVYAASVHETRRFLLRPTVNLQRSAGTLALESSDPEVPPLLDFDYFSDPLDRSRMREAIRFLSRLGDTAPLRNLLADQIQPSDINLSSDESLDAYILSNAATGHHASCTCRMGPESDPLAVVDPQGRVRGVANLCIVDASIMPDCVRANIQATVLMMAERIADWIRDT